MDNEKNEVKETKTEEVIDFVKIINNIINSLAYCILSLTHNLFGLISIYNTKNSLNMAYLSNAIRDAETLLVLLKKLPGPNNIQNNEVSENTEENK